MAASASSRFHEQLRDHIALHHAALLPVAGFGNRPRLAEVLRTTANCSPSPHCWRFSQGRRLAWCPHIDGP